MRYIVNIIEWGDFIFFVVFFVLWSYIFIFSKLPPSPSESAQKHLFSSVINAIFEYKGIDMPRKLPQLELDAQTRTALEERRTTASSSHRKRLEAILLASEHFDRTTIAARLGVSCNSVTSWIQCFLKNGFEGLESKPHILSIVA